MTIDGFWIADALGITLPTTTETIPNALGSDGEPLTVRWPELTPALITRIAEALHERQRTVLARRSMDEILTVLDRAAEVWLDPDYDLRKRAVAAISQVSGFSPEMVAHAIELEQVSSRRPDMESALRRELGDFRALDGFVAMTKGRTTAVGPGLIGGLFSANIPALPHLTVMRSFLVKAACLGRVSRGEPVYLPLYAESISRIDPELASCLGVLHWDSGRRDLEAAFLQGIDHLVAYGSDRTLGEVRDRAPAGLSATWHGHRMGFAVVGATPLEDTPLEDTPPEDTAQLDALGDALAYDFTVFDQHACLAPQACFVMGGGDVTPEALGAAIERGITRWLERLPPRRLEPETAVTLRAALDDLSLREVLGEPVQVLSPPDRLAGVVVVEAPDAFIPTPLERFVRVIPVDGPEDLFRWLEPVANYLQCAAVAGIDDTTRLQLARLGVTRLCPPGATGTPSMVWAHDGHRCIADLVRWCDEETVPPGESDTSG